MPDDCHRGDRERVVGVGCPGTGCCGPVYRKESMNEHVYGAWDEPTDITPENCPKHNWYKAAISNEMVCVRCGKREPLEGPNIHESAVIGGPAQWRGATTIFPVDIHHTATVGPLCQIDAGTKRTTIVGRDTQVMGMVHIGHGAQIGRGCDIASGTVIAGEVTIGDFVRIGIGACISPYVKIGDMARVGAGAVVIEDVESGSVVAGNPAKHLRWLNDDERAYALQLMLACP